MYSVTFQQDVTPEVISGFFGYLVSAVALWTVFLKAGRPNWAAFIPIYNIYVLIKIAGYNGALLILYFVPIVNLVVSIIVAVGVGRAFGKGGAFSFWLLWLLPIIGYLVVGCGSSTYRGDGGRGQ